MNWKRPIRWIAGVCLAAILLLVALLMTARFWLNQDWVKREIEQIVDSATGGRAQYDRIDLQFFPMPGAELTQVRFSLPGTVELQTASVAIDICLLPLLLGNVYPHRARIVAQPDHARSAVGEKVWLYQSLVQATGSPAWLGENS